MDDIPMVFDDEVEFSEEDRFAKAISIVEEVYNREIDDITRRSPISEENIAITRFAQPNDRGDWRMSLEVEDDENRYYELSYNAGQRTTLVKTFTLRATETISDSAR